MAFEQTFAERRHQSWRILAEKVEELGRYSVKKHSQVHLRDPSCPEWSSKGWIIGNSRSGSEPLSVVLTQGCGLYAGRLVIRHDAQDSNTVLVPSRACSESGKGAEGVSLEDASRAIEDVLAWPEQLGTAIDRIIAFDKPHNLY